MKKQILNLGKIIKKEDQKEINGGGRWNGYCRQQGSRCCHNVQGYGEFCDAGRCGRFGCFWY
ncbi:hypothetical protein [Tenacibaculum sp. MAR_2009_124]|uniref:hypothetical protein n=1 Tax=Tenacibaculum sp. MAR_2009_124 TaxID=1250059 RepID=UPI00115FDA24|nr:hypothetical protein [Tenacibaculum sp. MAR_2009_124]